MDVAFVVDAGELPAASKASVQILTRRNYLRLWHGNSRSMVSPINWKVHIAAMLCARAAEQLSTPPSVVN